MYNGAINLYAQKQINNCNKIADFYQTVIGLNQIDFGSNGGLGNTTILEERAFTRSRFVGQFDQNTSAQKGNRTEKIRTSSPGTGKSLTGNSIGQHERDLQGAGAYRASSDNVLPRNVPV